MGMPIKLAFDYIDVPQTLSYSSTQVLIVTGAIPVFYFIMALVAGALYSAYRQKKDLRKLFFLWLQYLSWAILGGGFLSSYTNEGGVMRLFWGYAGFNIDFLPVVGSVMATLLIFFGIFNVWKFLNISPSSEWIKVGYKRFSLLMYLVVIPLLVFYPVVYFLYPNPHVSSRLFSSLMIWVPVLTGIIAAMSQNSGFSKVPAFRDSEIRNFQPLFWGFSALIYAVILFLF